MLRASENVRSVPFDPRTSHTDAYTATDTATTAGRVVSAAKLGARKLRQCVLQRKQHLVGHVKLVLCDSVRTATTGVETKLLRFFVGSELSDTVVGPRGRLLCVFELDGNGCSSQVEETSSVVVTHHRLSTGWELCERVRSEGE